MHDRARTISPSSNSDNNTSQYLHSAAANPPPQLGDRNGDEERGSIPNSDSLHAAQLDRVDRVHDKVLCNLNLQEENQSMACERAAAEMGIEENTYAYIYRGLE